MTARCAPIGVFDSGIGGLTVVRALQAILPERDIVYLGDSARVPYGSKSPRTVERYSLTCLAFLLRQNVEMVLIACNTASATALPALRRASPVPVIGAVEPGAKAAAHVSTSGHVGILGTLATIRSQAYPRALSSISPTLVVRGQACPLFVPLADEGWTEGNVPRLVAEKYLQELHAQDPNIDTLVLGCTHYPLLAGILSDIGKQVFGHNLTLVDSASAMADEARLLLSRSGGRSGAARKTLDLSDPLPPLNQAPQPGELTVYVTDASRLEELAPRFLGRPVRHVLQIDL